MRIVYPCTRFCVNNDLCKGWEEGTHAEQGVICENDLLAFLYNLRLCVVHDICHALRIAREQGRNRARCGPLSFVSMSHTERLNLEAHNPRKLCDLVQIDEDIESQMIVQLGLWFLCLILHNTRNDAQSNPFALFISLGSEQSALSCATSVQSVTRVCSQLHAVNGRTSDGMK